MNQVSPKLELTNHSRATTKITTRTILLAIPEISIVDKIDQELLPEQQTVTQPSDQEGNNIFLHQLPR